MAHSSFGTGWPNCQPQNMVVLKRADGFARAFHKAVAELIAICIDVTEALGYDVRPGDSWGYSCRPIAGTSTPSNHSWGTAADINATTNPRRADRAFVSDIPRVVVDFWKGVGFRWGGNFSWPDPMHFEWMGTTDQARQKAADLRAFFAAQGGNTPPPPTPTGEVGYVIPETIRQGSTGSTVRKCQGLLLAHGYSLSLDGDFGPATHSTVTSFQRSHGLAVDGIVGPHTWRSLIES